MADKSDKKGRLLALVNLLSTETDSSHGLTTAQIIEKLSELGYSCDRKTLYSDIHIMEENGYDVVLDEKRGGGYKLCSREFELAELKLLVDVIQASKFVTAKKSKELIGKLETLVSRYEASDLNRFVYVADRNKTINESIFYTVDALQQAINENKQISCDYLVWDLNKELVLKGQSGRILNPFSLIWDDENYYLLAWDEKSVGWKHYRVDKMSKVTVLDSARVGQEAYEKLDIATYTDTTFGMFGGAKQMVSMDFPNYLIGVVLDRFGKEVTIRPLDEHTFRVRTNVVVSNQFFGWISAFGPEVKISGDEELKQKYFEFIKSIMKVYEDEC